MYDTIVSFRYIYYYFRRFKFEIFPGKHAPDPLVCSRFRIALQFNSSIINRFALITMIFLMEFLTTHE